MKRILFLSMILLAVAASLFAQETITGIAADLPILMHRSQATPGAFPLPWKRSLVTCEVIDRTISWAFGWGKNLETELVRCRYGSHLIHSYSLSWKYPFRDSLCDGVFATIQYRPYDLSIGDGDFAIGYTYNPGSKLALIPSLRLQGADGYLVACFGATWAPLRALSGHLGAACVFEDHGSLWKADLTLKVRFWKGLFLEEKLAGEFESHEYYSTYTNQMQNDFRISIRQEQYLGLMF